MQRRVEAQTSVDAAHAIALGGEFGVVPSREALQLCPAHPAGGEGAFVASGFEFGRCQCHLRPGLGRGVGVQTSRFEGVFVVVEHRGRAVEREAQHLPIGGGVVTGHRGHVGVGVEGHSGFFHDFAHRDDGALAGHHGGGAYLKHLQDVGRIASAEGGNGGGHGFVVTALERGHDFVLCLAGVEVLGQVVDPFAQRATHGVPPLNFGLCHGGGGDAQAKGQCAQQVTEAVLHGDSSAVVKTALSV